MGFIHYNTVPSDTKDILADLTGTQKTGILHSFATGDSVTDARHKNGVDSYAVRHLYGKIKEIENTCRILLRGELLITPEEIGDQGEVVTPAEYNTPPSSIAALKADVSALFMNDFTVDITGAVINKMIAYSKHDGTGDAVYYAAEVVK